MDNFQEQGETERMEAELRHCLKHVPAPEGFTGRVMDRVAAKQNAKSNVVRFPLQTAHRKAAWWSAIAAALLLAVRGDMMYLHHVREAQREADAQQQVELAMQLTNRAIEQVQGKVERSHAGRYTQIALELSK